MAPKLDRDAVLHSRDRHGLLSTYTYWKCRCEACRAANAAYHQQLRMSRNPKDAKEHGTLSTYVNYRCRCEVCSAANRGRFHAGS